MTTTALLREARRPFAGTRETLHPMRAWLAERLTDSGLGDPSLTAKAVFMANELAANAIRHTASGRGGTYSVMFRWSPCFLRIAVTDQGGTDTVPTAGTLADPCAESGRGLALIAAEAAQWGHHTVPGGGRQTWARIARTGGGE